MKKKLSQYLSQYVEGCSAGELEAWLMVPPSKEMGDFSLPCFQLAKQYHEPPKMVAQEIKEAMESEGKLPEFLKRIEIVNGYLNFYLKEEWYLNWLLEQSIENVYGEMKEGEGKTICIDYSSPNIAKIFHIGHLKTTVIGNSLSKIYQKSGYKVIGINHLGDWGTQFGKLLTAYKKWGSKEQVEKDGLDELLHLYVLFSEKAEENPELMEEARAWFKKMEEKDQEAMDLWRWFKDISMLEFQKIYDLLHVTFDSYSGESVFTDQVGKVVELLKQKKLLTESEGAYVVLLDEENLPPCLILKSNGTSIYPSRDIAAILYRKETYQFDKCLYVTGSEQQLHFSQVFHVIQKMGYEWWTQLQHVPYGLVSFQGEKLATRTGNMVFAKDLLAEAIERSKTIIMEKNPELKNQEEVAKQVGVGAVIFHDLFNVRIKNVSFVWDQVLNFDGATAPYIQYTFARANSILKKNGTSNLQSQLAQYASYYKEPSCKNLLLLLSSYQKTVLEAGERYEPCVIARFVYALAQTFNQFYQECSIQNAEPECREARLFLTSLVHHTIKDAMSLLGIECPEEM